MINRTHFSKLSLWLVIILGLNTALLGTAFGQPEGYMNGHMGRSMMGDWGMGWFGMIMMLLFWVLIIAGIVILIRWMVQKTSSRNRSNIGTGSQAMDILKERYAKGEISQDEFESMKKDILR
jgi:putative membrane protein